MKKTMLSVVIGCACLCGAQQVESTPPTGAERVARAEAELKRATEAKEAAKRELKEAQDALALEKKTLNDAEEARKKGISVEALYEQRLTRDAEAARIPLEQWKTMTVEQRSARKRAIGDAKTCKVSIDEWMAMTVEQQKAKKAEVRAARKAAKTAK